MRKSEINNGIEVYSDEKLTQSAGISRVCAKNAVLETAISRVILTCSCLISPAIMFKALELAKLNPKNPKMKIPYELAVFTIGLGISLPASISIFPQINHELETLRRAGRKIIGTLSPLL